MKIRQYYEVSVGDRSAWAPSLRDACEAAESMFGRVYEFAETKIQRGGPPLRRSRIVADYSDPELTVPTKWSAWK